MVTLPPLYQRIDPPPESCSVQQIVENIRADPTTVNVPNCEGWTPLRIAVTVWADPKQRHGRNQKQCNADALQLVRALLQCGADPSLASIKGSLNPVHEAARLGLLRIVKVFAEYDRHLMESESSVGLRPLHYAVESKNMDLLRYLVEVVGVDIQALTANGNSCLHYAGAVGWNAGYQYLLSRGVPDCSFNKLGWTPYGKLHWNTTNNIP
ncbi:hypothetical protein Pelo_2803 [Pelomyxa schiedti]|nr:hypothetical protein Pelo_2803 [Pelomyxa schiedti]